MNKFKFDNNLTIFSDLSESQRADLKQLYFDIVQNGISAYKNVYFNAWYNHFFPNDGDRNRLIIMSTVFPLKIGLMLMYF